MGRGLLGGNKRHLLRGTRGGRGGRGMRGTRGARGMQGVGEFVCIWTQSRLKCVCIRKLSSYLNIMRLMYNCSYSM